MPHVVVIEYWGGVHWVIDDEDNELIHWPLGDLNGIYMNNLHGNWVIDGWGISSEIAHIWLLLDLTDDKSTLVPLIA